MDVALILTALATGIAAGTTSGLTDAASTAIKQAYEALKTRIKASFAGKPGAEESLEEHEKDPDGWKAPLKKYLTEVKANEDPEIEKLVKQILDIQQNAGSGTSIAHASGGSIAIGHDNIGSASITNADKK